MADELDIALAGLRLAKVRVFEAKEKWWRFGPAHPNDVRDLIGESRLFFKEILLDGGDDSRLADVLKQIESVLHPTGHDGGEFVALPKLLLSEVSHNLLDVLVRLAWQARGTVAENAQALRAFVLYWLFFVTNEERASTFVYHVTCGDHWTLSAGALKSISTQLVEQRCSQPLPTRSTHLRDAVARLDSGRLPSWDQLGRTDPQDQTEQDALRHLIGHVNRRLLLWAQRDYVERHMTKLQPVAARLIGSDHVFDLDHLIPRSFFQSWRASRMPAAQRDFIDQRQWTRDVVGNYRILAFRENRSRGSSRIEEGVGAETIPALDRWNETIASVSANDGYWTTDLVDRAKLLVVERASSLIEDLLKAGLFQVAPNTTEISQSVR